MGTEILNIRAFAYMEPYGSMYGNPDHVISSPPPKRGGVRQKVQIPLCRHCLRLNFGPIK